MITWKQSESDMSLMSAWRPKTVSWLWLRTIYSRLFYEECFQFDYDLLVFRVFPCVYVCIWPVPVSHSVSHSVFHSVFRFLFSPCVLFPVLFCSFCSLCFPSRLPVFVLCPALVIVCTSPHVFHLCSITPVFPVCISLCASLCPCWFLISPGCLSSASPPSLLHSWVPSVSPVWSMFLSFSSCFSY